MNIDLQDWIAVLPGVVRARRKTDQQNDEGPPVKFNPMELIKLAINAAFISTVIIVTMQNKLDALVDEVKGIRVVVSATATEQARRTAAFNWAESKMRTGGGGER